ncbi:hypothetical protein BY996DRAFT_6533687 [Phakopsora pachyrhizi]|nr:hypothetical protein BY996DRAFT_6533687 [Phakopsora pachyrhizi]
MKTDQWYGWLGEEEWGIRSWDERTEKVVDSDHRRTEPLICRASGQCSSELEFQETLEEIEGLLMRGEGGEGKIANRLLLVLLLRMLLLLTGWRTPLPLRMLLPAKSSLKRSLVEVLVTDRLRSEADESEPWFLRRISAAVGRPTLVETRP